MNSQFNQKNKLYDILGVSPDATEQEIQRAYRKSALRYHPDRNSNDPSAAQKFKEASEAFEILRDPEKRRVYDAGGIGDVYGAGYQGFEDNEQVYSRFSDLFGDMFGGRARAGRAGPMPGRELRFVLSVDFKTAAVGGKTTVRVPIPVTCDKCNGSGYSGGVSPDPCSVCRGSGQISRQAAEQGGYFTIASPCPACQGSGLGGGTPCSHCQGEGRTVRNREIQVTIPAGVETGSVMRLKEQGQSGLGGGPNGDLLIEIQVEHHGTFSRDGQNIRSDISVPLVTALLGGKVDVQTVNGTVTLTIPPRTSSDSILRIRGQGINAAGTKGDHLVRVKIKMPEREFSEEEQGRLRKWLAA